MTARIATAPGKVMLCGEYAVLHGAPAIVAAVDRRAQVTAIAGDSDKLRLTTRGYRDGSRRLRVSPDGRLDWLDAQPGAAGFALLEAVCRSRPSALGAVAELRLDTRDFVAADGRKLGLGSSAALSVALLAALTPGETPQQLANTARTAHNEFQGGRGSGADIASAVYGGVIEYRLPAETAPASPGWPPGLVSKLLWSGQPASTAGKIRRLDARLVDGQAPASLQRLAGNAAAVAAAWRAREVDALLDEFAAYVVALRAFDQDHGLGVFAAGHAGLLATAAECGVVYKPCGAGGGDIGVALAREGSALERFAGCAKAAGFEELDASFGERGVIVREESV